MPRRLPARWAASLALATLLASSAVAQDLFREGGAWVDDQARTYDLAALHGRPTVLTMAYGACRRVCSTSLRIMEGVQALADRQHAVVDFVVLGLDPAQDLPADWAAFRSERKLTRANWHFLSADPATVQRMAERLGIRYWHYGEHTMHDFKIVLLATDGQVAHSMNHFDQDPAMLLPSPHTTP